MVAAARPDASSTHSDPLATQPDSVVAPPDPVAASRDVVAVSPEGRPRPPELAVGLGFRPGTSTQRLLGSLREVLGDKPIACLATIDRRADELGLRGAATRLDVPVRTYTAAELAQVDVPNPSARTDDALGTASVAEAAALLAAGGPLVIPKRTVDGIVIAAALTAHQHVPASPQT
ncbi:cobalamin biosynthesis protein [Nocardia nepalensis]|uniref:cobalamin biosynthesis protein n=1 Tax=Nocardia nepalensis TaxID=3375448 RepID=UPI003B6701E5